MAWPDPASAYPARRPRPAARASARSLALVALTGVAALSAALVAAGTVAILAAVAGSLIRAAAGGGP